MQGALYDCLDPKTGQIIVNNYLQVCSLHHDVVYPFLFSVGDVCRTPADEAKSIVPIHQMTSVLA